MEGKYFYGISDLKLYEATPSSETKKYVDDKFDNINLGNLQNLSTVFINGHFHFFFVKILME